MPESLDEKITRATAALYVREVAKAQVVLDRAMQGFDNCNEVIKATQRLEFCQAKAREWADKALSFDPFEIARRHGSE